MAKRPSNKRIVETFKKKACNVSVTCDALKINRSTFYRWKSEDPKLSEMLEEVEESLLDMAESKLLQKIQEGETVSIFFFLKTKGKHRGYVEKVEQQVNINPFLELMQEASQEDDQK